MNIFPQIIFSINSVYNTYHSPEGLHRSANCSYPEMCSVKHNDNDMV